MAHAVTACGDFRGGAAEIPFFLRMSGSPRVSINRSLMEALRRQVLKYAREKNAS